MTYTVSPDFMDTLASLLAHDPEDALRREEAAREAAGDFADPYVGDDEAPAEDDAECAGCAWCDPTVVGRSILDLFAIAPKMKALQFDGLRIGRAGATSSNPGGLWVTDGGSWGDSVYFGRINADGTFRARPQFHAQAREQVRRLAAFGPMEIARVGRATGRCVYCARFLDDPTSVALGYGPVCAKYHGLPHNAKAILAMVAA